MNSNRSPLHKKNNSNFIPYLQERDGLGKLLEYKVKLSLFYLFFWKNNNNKYKYSYTTRAKKPSK